MANSKQEKRVTVTYTDVSYHERISELAREHKISQGEVIEVLLDGVHDIDHLFNELSAKRTAKVAGRTSIRAIIQRTKGMNADQRSQALKGASK